ncbi:hypothetical protein NP493_1292g00026 [Ridgeia piscesae]|uniref:ZP domain-containing protein n=1 Tax=Ridgeia piscesae TaxID=27915 RepID=A0AAD9K9I6_RIDPI|nr:hypothetical protein NP493_1292g00026 [Ridgeia piscesae]
MKLTYFEEPTNCSTDADCHVIHAFSVCALIDEPKLLPLPVNNSTLSHVVTALTSICRCDEAWTKEEGRCWYYVTLGVLCDRERSRCDTPNSECRPDGDNTGQSRCQCIVGHVRISPGETEACVNIITTAQNATCRPCETNDGVCYSVTGVEKAGCVCPTSRSGPDCSYIHVNVSCDVNTFTMRICYDPHEGVNFTAGSLLYAFGKGRDLACTGWTVSDPDDGLCQAGHVRLDLPLDSTKRDRCGTKRLMADPTTLKYETRLVVQRRSVAGADDIVFKTFCSFRTHADISFRGVGVVGLAGNDRGEHKNPRMTLTALTQIGEEIPQGVALRLGDGLRFRIQLLDDGTYTAARVEACTASSSASMPDWRAVSVPLVIRSCPAAGQDVITLTNQWRPSLGQGNVLRTGIVRMFSLGTGHAVFIHCTVKLCLTGSERDCDQVHTYGPSLSPL